MEQSPPGERDLFRLSCDPFVDVVAAHHAVFNGPLDEALQHARLSQISGILVDQAVGVIRTGSIAEIAEATLALGRSVTRLDESRLEISPFDYSHLVTRGVASVLAAACSTSSIGGEYSVFRALDAVAAKLFCEVVDTPDIWTPYDHLLGRLNISQEAAFRGTQSLHSAGLIDTSDRFLHKGSTLCLGPRKATAELMAVARVHAERFDANNLTQEGS